MDIHVPSMDIEPNTPLDAEQRDRSAGPDSEERLPPKETDKVIIGRLDAGLCS